MPNIFDQFDEPQQQAAPVNIFDQFDTPAADDTPSPVAIAAQSAGAADAAFRQPRRQAELRAYEPGWRDRVARFLLPSEKAHPQYEQAVEGLLGSRGLGRSTPIAAVDFTPLGIPLAANEMDRAAKEGDPVGVVASSLAMIPAPGVGPAARLTRAAASPAALEIGRDLRAFQRSGVRPFGPAFSQAPTASVARQLAETPVIGSPVRNALQESLTDAGAATTRIADQMSPVTSHDQVGVTLQGGLDRFRSAHLEDLDPATVQALGIQPNSPVPRAQVMSAGAAQRAQQAAPIRQAAGGGQATTTRGVQVPAAQPLQQTLTARTGVADLSDAELARVVRAPSSETSFAARSDALYERADRTVPRMFRSDGSANPGQVAAVNTRHALGQLERQIANDISGQTTLNGPLAERLRGAQSGNFQLDQLRAIRTEIGRALSNTNPLQQTLNRGQLMSLYGAVSRDIEVGLMDIANRAHINSRLGNNVPNYVHPDVARQADGALRAFRTADRYFRQGMGRIERFHQILGATTPEQAATRLVRAATTGGRGDIGMMRAAHAALRPEEWRDVSGLVLRSLGQPEASAGGMTQAAQFSVERFARNWRNMDPRAREMLFGGEHSRAINDLFRVVNRLSEVQKTVNTSRSGTNTLNVLGVLTPFGAAFSGGLPALMAAGATGGGGLGLSVLLSRPQYARWAARYAQLRANLVNGPMPGRVNAPQALTAHVARLAHMARTDQELQPVVRAIVQDNVRAGSESGDQQQ